MRSNWIALVWRLPSGPSTPRVTIWRALKRLGAASLTPGAALLPFRVHLLEQLGWIAQDIDEMGGDAWVLPVTELTEVEESSVRAQVNGERDAEYLELTTEATRRAAATPHEVLTSRELGGLRRRLQRIGTRDHYGAAGRLGATRAVDECVASNASRYSPRTVSIATN